MSTNVKWLLNKARSIWSTRPRSFLEFYECVRDDIVFMPQFQWVWWWTGCCVVCCEYALAMTTEFCLMSIMCYVLFTLPCLRFCSVWTKLYQQRRNAKPPDEEKAEVSQTKQKKKKAMTEEEMLEATRKRQKNRAGGVFLFNRFSLCEHLSCLPSFLSFTAFLLKKKIAFYN